MKAPFIAVLSAATFLSALAYGADVPKFLETFPLNKGELVSQGRNDYCVLKPGFVAVFEGDDHGKKTVLTITVTDETKVVDGVKTRVVEEREVGNGELVEISRNYFAISKKTADVYYFGEDSTGYRHGKPVTQEGSWLAGVAGARFGLAMPGKPKVGDAYYQELAPKVAQDHAEIVSLNKTRKTPAGEYTDCLKTKETTPLEKGAEYKYYAPGIGMVQDEELRLVKVTPPAKP